MKRKFFALAAAGMCMCIFASCAGTAQTSEEQTEPVTESSEMKAVDAEKGDENKKAVLVVSFGTSYNDSREKTIGSVENAIKEAFPDYEQRRAFTSQIIIDKLKERDNEEIDNVETAMQRLIDDGVGTLVVQPTHVMNGEEYDEMLAQIAPYEDNFVSIKYGKPLLTSSEDYVEVINALVAEVPQVNDEDTAVVFMGHGTEHFANATYAALDYRFKALGYDNVFITTVEGYPDFDKTVEELAKTDVKKVVLLPLMIVAGDHANNDMAGDEEDSLKTIIKKEGYEVECVIKGLGEYKGIQEMFVEHCGDAINAETEE